MRVKLCGVRASLESILSEASQSEDACGVVNPDMTTILVDRCWSLELWEGSQKQGWGVPILFLGCSCPRCPTVSFYNQKP